MTAKHFFGKKEHSTTYAAASFLMPGAAARVEAIRAKKRKLKHPSPPPPAPEAPPVADHVKEPPPDHSWSEAGAQKEQQAEILVDKSTSANHDEGHKSQADVVETESATVTDTPRKAVSAEIPGLAEQHDKLEAAGAPIDSVYEYLVEPDLPATIEVSVGTTDSLKNGDETMDSPVASRPEAPEIKQASQPEELTSTQEVGQTGHRVDRDHEENETLNSTNENDSKLTQHDKVAKVDHSFGNKESGSKDISTLSEHSEPKEEPARITEVVHEQNEKQASLEHVTPTRPSAAEENTTTDNKPATDSVEPARSSDAVEDEIESAHTITSALNTNIDPEKKSGNNSPPSTPSSPSRHTPLKPSDFHWVKRPEFD